MRELGARLGAYELVRLLAQGGMADVYLARQRGLDRLVAVKVLNAQRAADQDASTMFMDEARLAGMLDHGNLASVYGVDVADGEPFLAMEYVHGADLREILSKAEEQQRAIDYDCALSIVAGAAAGLDHAHRRCDPAGRPLHLVHRDVSLTNIMVSYEGAVKVIDFGIASSAASVHTTQPGIVRGKAAYMSPEQCMGKPVDLRTDVFALGIVLYELTTGRRCFNGETDFERMLAVVRGDYVPPSVLIPDFPLALEQVIRTALANAPTARYASAAALIDALEAAALIEGWSLGAHQTTRLMRELFGSPFADGLDDDTTLSPPPEHVPAMTTLPARRLARGSMSDLHAAADAEAWQEDAPTRGRPSLSRYSYHPLVAA
jgi:serine/threonine-protein kinase